MPTYFRTLASYDRSEYDSTSYQYPSAILIGAHQDQRQKERDERHEFQHHIDTLGLNAAAARIVRNNQMRSDKLVDIYPNKTDREWGLKGFYRDDYDSKLYATDRTEALAYSNQYNTQEGAEDVRQHLNKKTEEGIKDNDFVPTEFMTMAAQRICDDVPMHARAYMLDAWQHMPDQLAAFIATNRGAFVPF
jgi:hypothetical protein